jgi:uncharacterized protein YbcI
MMEGRSVMQTEADQPEVAQDGRGPVMAAISNGISGLQREHYGRGAGRARTIMQGDFVVCFLEDIYVPVERTLIEAGRWDQVRATRLAFQDALEPDYRAIVEQHTGRQVIAFFSQVSHEPDMALEGFVLAPRET